MEELARRVIETTSLEPTIAKAAIGTVLLFLKDEAPDSHVGEFIDKTPLAQQFVAAAGAAGDGGVTQVIEGMTSFMGRGRADVNILAGKLEKLGLTQRQTDALLRQVLARAEVLIGREGVTKIMTILPALAERTRGPEEMRRSA